MGALTVRYRHGPTCASKAIYSLFLFYRLTYFPHFAKLNLVGYYRYGYTLQYFCIGTLQHVEDEPTHYTVNTPWRLHLL